MSRWFYGSGAAVASLAVVLLCGVTTLGGDSDSTSAPVLEHAVVQPLAQGESLEAIPRPQPTGERHAFGGGTAPVITGFEPFPTEDPGYVVGLINEQNGWTTQGGVGGGDEPGGVVAADNPANGDQHLRLIATPDGGEEVVVFSPNVGDLQPTPASVSVLVYIPETTTAQYYEVQPQAPSQDMLTTTVRFVTNNLEIQVLDDPDGDGTSTFQPIGVYTPGQYVLLTITIDPCLPEIGGTDTWTVDYGGVFFYIGDGFFAGTVIEEVVFVRENTEGEGAGDFDDFSHTLEDQCGGACCFGLENNQQCYAGFTPDGWSEGDCVGAGGTFEVNETCPTCVCGDPAAGECGEAGTTPGCNEPVCCSQVCELFPACCGDGGGIWDAFCATIALDTCIFYGCNATAASPENDCCDPDGVDGQTGPTEVTLVEGAPVVLDFDTTDSTTDTGVDDGSNPCSSANNDDVNHRDLYYIAEGPADGQLTVSTCLTAEHDTKISIYEVDGPLPGDDFNCVLLPTLLIECNEDCSDDSVFFSSELVVTVISNRWYLVRVGTYSGADGCPDEPDCDPCPCDEGAESGSGSVLFDFGAFPPLCDDEEDADQCPVEDGANLFSNQNVATGENATTDGPTHEACGFAPQDRIYNDVWFEYTATTTGGLRIDTCGTADFDTKIAVYEGCDVPASDANLLACEDGPDYCPDGTSSTAVAATQGLCYLIRVGASVEDGENSFGGGALTITPDCDVGATATITEEEACGQSSNPGCNGGGSPEEFVFLNNVYEEVMTVQGEIYADGDIDYDEFDITVQDQGIAGRSKVCYGIKSSMPISMAVLGGAAEPSCDDGVDSIDECGCLNFIRNDVASEACEPAYSEYLATVFTDIDEDGIPEDGDGPGGVFTSHDIGFWVAPLDPDFTVGFITDGFPCADDGGVIDNSYQFCFVVTDFLVDCSTLLNDEICGFTAFAPADLNQDGVVNAADLAQLLGAWGPCDPPCPPSCAADLNGDCIVNAADLAQLLGAWG